MNHRSKANFETKELLHSPDAKVQMKSPARMFKQKKKEERKKTGIRKFCKKWKVIIRRIPRKGQGYK